MNNARGRFTAGVCGQCDGNGGARAAEVWRLRMDLMDLMDLMDNVGAPVFALMGYAAASHGITRGVCGTLCGLARAIDVPQG